MEGSQDVAVVALFKALAHPLRARIVHRLTDGQADVGELVELLGVSQPLVSHHLKILRDAHLVEVERMGRSNRYGLIDDHARHIFLDAWNHMKEHDHDCEH